MKYLYCPTCGNKLTQKEIGDEGMVPYCAACERPWFEHSYSCIIAAVINEYEEIALIKQSYVSEHYVCVASYLKAGETAEQTAAREIEEELGVVATEVSYLDSYYYEKKDLLMLGFLARVKKADFSLSKEVDSAMWFDKDTAIQQLKEASIAKQVVIKAYQRLK